MEHPIAPPKPRVVFVRGVWIVNSDQADVLFDTSERANYAMYQGSDAARVAGTRGGRLGGWAGGRLTSNSAVTSDRDNTRHRRYGTR